MINRKHLRFQVRILQWGGYLTSWQYATLAQAKRWASVSGFSAAPIASDPNGQRLGRIWIEDRAHPATLHRDYVKIAMSHHD